MWVRGWRAHIELRIFFRLLENVLTRLDGLATLVALLWNAQRTVEVKCLGVDLKLAHRVDVGAFRKGLADSLRRPRQTHLY